MLNEEIEKFYRTANLKWYIKDLNKNPVPTEEQIFKSTNHKMWTPKKIVIPYLQTLKPLKMN